MAEKYNGWANYPTWNVSLWLANDEGLYSTAQEYVRNAVENNTDHDDDHAVDKEGATADLAEALEEFCDEITPALSGFAADIHGWAMGFVDWCEIAAHLVDEEVEGTG